MKHQMFSIILCYYAYHPLGKRNHEMSMRRMHKQEIDLLQQHMAICLSTSYKLCQLGPVHCTGNTTIFGSTVINNFSLHSLFYFCLYLICYLYKGQKDTDNQPSLHFLKLTHGACGIFLFC